jgi:hypothetical protein
MAFQSKDGKSFGSKFVAKRRDDEHAKMGKDVMGATSPAENKPAPATEQEPAEQEQKPMQEDPKQVAMEHGPATDVTIHHDHKSGKHHVVSHHADGHMHMSDHASAKEAHDAATQLSGGDQQPAEASAAPAEASDGFQMPRLA